MNHTARRLAGGAVLLALLMYAGCAQLGIGFTKIGDLIAAPERYAGKEVRVQGKVTNILKIPFVATKIYSIQDDTGEINVRTQVEVPLAGSVVRIKGVLDTVAAVGGQNVGVHLRETERN
jgi:hypothetical protein